MVYGWCRVVLGVKLCAVGPRIRFWFVATETRRGAHAAPRPGGIQVVGLGLGLGLGLTLTLTLHNGYKG